MTTVQFFEHLKDSMVSAFMNAPQLDGRNVRVPSDFTSKQARVRLEKQEQDSSYWAVAPQFPVLPSK
jgi:hypothetical protein